jgi:hypothetical protein
MDRRIGILDAKVCEDCGRIVYPFVEVRCTFDRQDVTQAYCGRCYYGRMKNWLASVSLTGLEDNTQEFYPHEAHWKVAKSKTANTKQRYLDEFFLK